MRDIDIRNKLKSGDLEHFFVDPNSKVVEELEIGYGDSIVDIAIVNGALHGYEIKSNHDNLGKLEKQLRDYSKVFDFLTFVIGDKHLEQVKKILPSWCGLIAASDAKDIPYKVSLELIKSPSINTDVDVFTVFQFLWKEECIFLLGKKGITKGLYSKNRVYLWSMLSKLYDKEAASLEVRALLKSRVNWKSQNRSFQSVDC